MLFANFFEPKPFNQGYLPKKDGHEVFFWEFGNKNGIPIISTHGGPGGQTKAIKAKQFDLKKYRYIMFDQRGCGKSRPFGELKNNTTQDIIDDVCRLIDFLRIKEKVIVHGASWSSTIALLFAIKYPSMVSRLLLSCIFLADENYKKWVFEDSANFYPDVLEKIKTEVKGKNSIPEYYLKLLCSEDEQKQREALSLYAGYENVLGAIEPKTKVLNMDDKTLTYARVYMHYDANDFFMPKDYILKNADKIRHIPTLMVHNRLDMVCPLIGAFDLARSLPRAKLVIVPDMGHGSRLLNKTMKKEIKNFLEGE